MNLDWTQHAITWADLPKAYLAYQVLRSAIWVVLVAWTGYQKGVDSARIARMRERGRVSW